MSSENVKTLCPPTQIMLCVRVRIRRHRVSLRTKGRQCHGTVENTCIAI